MQNVILIPDSFKGTMPALTVCRIMEKCIQARFPHCKTVSIPIADGGEGTVDAFLYAAENGEKKISVGQGPYGEMIHAAWGKTGDTALMEMASCAGLPLVGDKPDPGTASTFGLGMLIGEALNANCRKIIVGVGGSCTNDGGCGMAAALGIRFFNAEGNRFVPTGRTLSDICRIDASALDGRLAQTELICLCDVDNPLYGTNGAAYVFAPQKGADKAMVRMLDEGLRHLSRLVEKDLNFKGAEDAGAGAAGGCGFGMKAFLGAKLQAGIEVLLDFTGFDRLLENADHVFTGEGRLDSQSLHGKAISGIARRARKAGVPVTVVAGEVSVDAQDLRRTGITAAYATKGNRTDMQEIRQHCQEDLAQTMKSILQGLT
ncbi:MAG: glycerate kinase [Bacteroidales bacterium]|nr:glycerate kinase [Bacteroidales bacterium]